MAAASQRRLCGGPWPALSGAVPRRDDTSHREVGHPLLATLGRDLRELQRSLPDDGPRPTSASDPADRPDTLLGWLQSDIAANAVRPRRPVRWPPTTARCRCTACHGPARQVDVLREVLLGLLADDPTLEPRDILVMCPDIETYAPLIDGGVRARRRGARRGHPAHRLRVRLADRALDPDQPAARRGRAAARPGRRPGHGERRCSTWLESEPVRRRFGFSDDDLDAIAAWVRESGIRWAFDAEHRSPFGLSTTSQNTWRFGLDRVLAGVAMSDDSAAWLGHARCRSTTSAATGSTWSAGSPSTSNGCSDCRPIGSPAPGRSSDWLAALGDGVSTR